jgi:hypothetical protein
MYWPWGETRRVNHVHCAFRRSIGLAQDEGRSRVVEAAFLAAA